MKKIIVSFFLLLGLSLIAGNEVANSGAILVNPYFIEVQEKTPKVYTISLHEDPFLPGGEYQDFNDIICDPKTKVALVELRKTAITENKFIAFNYSLLEPGVESKRVETVRKNKKNSKVHEYRRVIESIYYKIKDIEQVFSVSNESFPEVQFVLYSKSELQRIPERLCWSNGAKAYDFTKNGTPIKLRVAGMDSKIAQTLESIFYNKKITHISVNEYAEQALNKGLAPGLVFKAYVMTTEKSTDKSTESNSLLEFTDFGSAAY